jgi:cobalt-zinc-cadmium efflux system outer membrane protein
MQICMPIQVAVATLLLAAGAHAQPPQTLPGVTLITPAEDFALRTLARDAVSHHPQVLAARAGLETQRAFEQAADRPLFNPELQLDAANSDSNDRTLGFSQTLDIARQGNARFAVAVYESDFAVAELASARREIAGELLSVLAAYWTAAGLDELAEVRIDLMRTFANLTLQRQQAGDLTQVELNIANLAYAQAEIEHASAEAARAGADQAMRALVATPAQTDWPDLPEALPAIAIQPSQIEQLLAGLPEIRGTRAAINVAQARIDLRERERRANPTLSLTAGEENNESLVGISFTMPLNIRNRFQYEVLAARSERTQAERQADNAEVRARRRLLAGTERHRLIRDAWESWLTTGEPNLGQQAELLRRLVTAGELSTTDYLVQLNQTLDTAASALELRRQLWLAWFEWLIASGQIEAWLGLEEGA